MSSERFFDLPAGFNAIIAFLKLGVEEGWLAPAGIHKLCVLRQGERGQATLPDPELENLPFPL